jgi:WD40 repeat protein
VTPTNHTITQLVFHPTDANLLLSGSTDGVVNICDTRISDEDEVVLQAINHGSVHKAGFLSTTQVYAASHDEKFALYDMAENVEKGSAIHDLGNIRESLGCEYLATVVPKMNFAGATLGVGATSGSPLFKLIHLAQTATSASGWDVLLDQTVGLPGAHGEELVRSFCVVDEIQTVFTAGEDGCVKVWRSE